MNEELALPPKPTRNPATQKAFRRQVWLQVYLPFALGFLLLALIAFLLWGSNMAGASAWADASLILLLLPVIVLSVIPIVLLAALVYGVTYLTRQIPVPAHQAQQSIAKIGRIIELSTKRAIQPLIVVKAGAAAASSVADKLQSILRRNG